jgi:RNA polymerase sigma factor (sigma-70 family)
MARMDPVRTTDGVVDEDSRERVRLATEIFRKYGGEIRAMIRVVAGDQSQADDLFQNLFLSLVAKPLPSDIRSIKRYLYKAIVNDVISQCRREKCRFKHIRIYAIHQRRGCVEEDPRDLLIRAEQTRRMLEIVDRLRPTEAQAVLREYALDHDRDKASGEMGIKRRSFTKYLSRGMKRLRFIAISREGMTP